MNNTKELIKKQKKDIEINVGYEKYKQDFLKILE